MQIKFEVGDAARFISKLHEELHHQLQRFSWLKTGRDHQRGEEFGEERRVWDNPGVLPSRRSSGQPLPLSR